MRYRIMMLIVPLQIAALALTADEMMGQLATVEVENQLDREMLVWINGEPRVVAPANGRVSLEGVPEGPVTLLASGLHAEGIEASRPEVP